MRKFSALTALGLTASLAGCSGNGGDGSGDGGTTVEMRDELVFDPDSVTVGVGETVTWENVGSVGHTVTAYSDEIPENAEYFASGGLNSEQAARDSYAVGDPDTGDIAGGETFEHTFEVAGTYEYFCVPHESAGMVGTVEVQ